MNQAILWSGAMLLLSFVPLLVLLPVSYAGWQRWRRQAAFMDHQQQIGDRIADRNQSYQDMISAQYREVNERSDHALAQSAEALRLHAAALEQMMAMNKTLERIAQGIDSGRDGA